MVVNPTEQKSILEDPVLWDAELCHSKAQGHEPPNDEGKLLGAAYLVMLWHIPENLNLQLHPCENHKTCKFIFVWLMGFSVTAMCVASVYFMLSLPLSTAQ